MITKQQALEVNEFHFQGFKKGQPFCYKYRRNGKTVTWIRKRDDWEIPVVYGLRGYARICYPGYEEEKFHPAEDCPFKD